MKITGLCTFAVFLIAAQVPPDAQVAGKFTVKGTTVKLAHVYAFWKPRLMHETTSDLYVLISDEPIPPDTIQSTDAGVAKMAALVREDKIHAFELHFDGDTDNLFDGEEAAVYYGGIAVARMGENGAFRFTATAHD